MAGFSTVTGQESIMFADNVSFDGTSRDGAVTTDGQLLIGSTSTPNIKVGSLTSPNSTITIGYSDPNITLDLAGGTEAIDSVAVQTGTTPVRPTAAGLLTINGSTVAAGTNPVRTDGTGPNTMAIEVQTSQAVASADATKIGLANFNSAHFSVDANGFVSSNNGDFPWTDQNASFTAVSYNGYFCTGNHTSTLPASPAQGDTISIVRATGGGWVIQANTGQTITVGASSSSSAGTATSNATGDSMTLVYKDTSNTWFATSVIGTWTLA